jgi:hypothetical protein
MKRLIGFGLVLALLVLDVPGQKNEMALPLRFDDHHTLDQVYRALEALNKAFPELTKLETAGTTEEGRPIMAMTVNNPETGAPLEKPGVYVDGNIHGNEIQGGDICLYLLDYILGRYGNNREITELIDKNAIYVVPVVNPDGRFHFMTDANTSSSNRSLRIPLDDDRDGLVDEDYPDDLDGDGNICQMRRRDPFGRLKTDPEDPRLMVPVKPGEKGEWTLLGMEGLDNDSDGRVNEDSEGYVDPNRNWGFDWAPPYVQGGAGEYPFQSVGFQGLSRWIMTKTNISIGWSFHNSGGMFLRGPSRQGLGEYPPQDITVYDYIGKQAERIMPGYKYLIGWKDLYTTYGDSLEWLAQMTGAYGYVAEVFQVETETFRGAGEKTQGETGGEEDLMSRIMGGSRDRERIQFNDHVMQGELYKPWKAFKHPTYGDVEIGGWVKMSTRLGAPFMLKDLVHRNAMVVLFSAKQTPEISFDVFDVQKTGKNLFRIRTRLVNGKAIPTMTYQAQKVKLYPQDMLKVSGSGAEVVAGGLLIDVDNDRVNYKEYKPEIQFLTVPGFGKIEHQFLVSGKGKVSLRYESRHGGTMEKTIELK